MIAALLGGLMGGVILVSILALIVSRFAFKYDEPQHRAAKTAMTAATIAILVSLFGAGFNPIFQGTYIVAGLIVWPLMLRHYKKHWTDDDAGDVFR